MTDLMRLLIAGAALVQTAEDVILRRTTDVERPFALTRAELPCAAVFDRLFSTRGLTLILAARAAAALALILTPRPLDAAVLIVGTWLWAVRWRGTFNGGSDAMTLIVLIGTLIALIDPRLESAAHAYVAAHLITSFFVAGLVKIKNAGWRTGAAPAAFLKDAGVVVPTSIARAMAWTVIVFELSFPLAVVNPAWAAGFTVVGVSFHVINAYVFGLNRFLWTWAAAYPALWALAAR